MNKKQKAQVAVAVGFAILLILWLCMPGWGAAKIISIVSALMIIASMALSYIAEEKGKNSK